MPKPLRFTVYSNDAKVLKTGTLSRPRLFQWNLNIPITSGNYSKMAVESVFCRNIRTNITKNKPEKIMDFEITSEGVIDHDPNHPVFFSTQTITGIGTGVTFIFNEEDDFFSLIVRDKGLDYEVVDTFYILNADGTLPDNDRTVITVLRVTRSNSITHDLISIPTTNPEETANIMRMISLANQDEKELYSVRCRYISNAYDTRKKHVSGGKIIYPGPLNFQNNNPQNSFCYELNSIDFLNGSFELSVDSKFLSETGISPDVIYAITFILME